MKILLVTESYWPNTDGGALFEQRLVHGMIDRGHQVRVWAPGNSLRNYDQKDQDSLIFRERAIRLIFNRKYKVSLLPSLDVKKVFQRFQPDVVHIHNPFMLGRTAMKYCKRHNIPVMATNHLMPENILLNLKGSKLLYNPLYRFVWHYLVRFHNRANYVTTPTPTALKFLVKNGLTVPSQAVTNGVDAQLFSPRKVQAKILQKYSLPTDVPILLYVGRVDGEKRLDITLKALPAVLKQQPCHLVIAGYGVELEPLKKLADELGITSQVTFTGFIDEPDKPLLYNCAELFVISSPAELQSIVTLEAMASELPVVATDVAALHELVHDGTNGYLFAENNAPMLASKVTKLLANSALREKFGKASRQIVLQHHTTNVMFNTYESIYQELTRS